MYPGRTTTAPLGEGGRLSYNNPGMMMSMARRPEAVRIWEWPALAWLMSRAFMARIHPTPVLAVAVWPMYFLTLAPAVLLGGAYWRDRDGMVIIHRYRPLLDGLLVIVLMLAAVVAMFSLLQFGGWAGWLLLVAAGWFWVSAILALVGNGMGTPLTLVGRGTPKGRRWAVAGLAQRPGTRLTAVMLARDIIGSLPAGSVVLAAAADDKLLAGYLRFGFVQGSGRRCHMVVEERA